MIDIQDGQPIINGLYVVYVDDEYISKYAKKMFLIWMDRRWCYLDSDQFYRGVVHGWIGPIPALKLENA